MKLERSVSSSTSASQPLVRGLTLPSISTPQGKRSHSLGPVMKTTQSAPWEGSQVMPQPWWCGPRTMSLTRRNEEETSEVVKENRGECGTDLNQRFTIS